MKKERHVCARWRVGEPAVSKLFTSEEGCEVHAMPSKAWHVCGRPRDGEAAVSCENEAGGLFQQPAGHAKMPTVL
jgi:hypothetical protein